MPIVKEHALPVAKTVGKEFLRTATKVAKDTLNGEDIGQSTKKRFKETIENFSKLHQGEGLILKPGLSINTRRKKKNSNRKKKKKTRILDIFDKK